MTCPDCGSDNRDSAERCDACGHALALPRGTVLAGALRDQEPARAWAASAASTAPTTACSTRWSRSRSSTPRPRARPRCRGASAPRSSSPARSATRTCARSTNTASTRATASWPWSWWTGSTSTGCCASAGRLPPKEAFDIAIQVTKGLAAIHEAGVIHRDLKTPNIMRDARGDVRLLDFGIAKLSQPDRHPGRDRRAEGGGHPRVHEPRADPRRRPRRAQRHLRPRDRDLRALHGGRCPSRARALSTPS